MTVDQFISYLTFAVDFVKALLVPVVIASPLIALLIDQVLKRLPFWKNDWAGWANLILNMIFSGLLFVAARTGYESEYIAAIAMSTSLLPIIVRLFVGIWGAKKFHIFFTDHGLGRSMSNAG